VTTTKRKEDFVDGRVKFATNREGAFVLKKKKRMSLTEGEEGVVLGVLLFSKNGEFHKGVGA